MKYGMLAGDFMLSANILISGNNYSKIALLFKFMNMGMVGRNTYFTIQDVYCIDTIKKFWMEKRAELIVGLQNKDVVILADGRCDTPGHCAQYCTYTTMENDSKKIINVVTVDKRQTDLRSAIMEKQAFILTVDQLIKEVKLVEVCTDAHCQISALMDPVKGKYKDNGIHHSLDMWHGAKNLSKKMSEAALVKDQTVLLHWLKDIISDFWWCCKTADSYEEFLQLWIGVVHHVCNEHKWAMGVCKHGPLPADTDKTWIERDSKAHKALVEIILRKRWLKDVHKFLRFRYHRVYKKHAKHYGVYTLRTPKSYNYIGELQTSVDQNSSPVLPYEGVTITLLLPNRSPLHFLWLTNMKPDSLAQLLAVEDC
ncbi:uncharacterized protein LOC121712884 isoform X3 [Alosa sapidissima]|uniref:uncharacterized protein LOC121712884 isoform X3 n=1 Tax=Alosa sapidissima TaxID=34773 RepID=UPI001C09125E|nr:uncharacterized protein LOC121712884 isoform X3 [Alosa sapidissima]